MFRDREDAALRLAMLLKAREFRDPVVLAIPRGGLAIGAVLARELGADLDVVLTRKLRAPEQPELALGAIAEGGQVYLTPQGDETLEVLGDYLSEERRYQLDVIARHQELFRQVRPAASLAGRSAIVTDDGIATGATMIAALQVIRRQHPFELIVAVPVAAPDRLAEVAHWCDEAVCLHTPTLFWAIGQFYNDFTQVDDEKAVELLRKHGFADKTRRARPREKSRHDPVPT